MTRDLKALDNSKSSTGKHKEEGVGRMKSDLSDRLLLHNKHATCINPLSETDGDFATAIVNIATGKMTPDTQTNIQDCLKIGKEQLVEFRSSLPDGFKDSISNRIKFAQKIFTSCDLIIVPKNPTM